MATANKNDDIILELNVDNLASEDIKKAAKIANSIMNTRSCLVIFNDHFEIDSTMPDRMKKVNIKFEKYRGNGNAYAWTNNGNKSCHVIRINKILQDRLNHDQCLPKEKKLIITLMSICIVHEVSHLIMRWKGYLRTPRKFSEAGYYLEKVLFGNKIYGLIYKNNKDRVWDSNCEFVGK